MATILLTRPQAQSEALAKTLSAQGWSCLIAPMLHIQSVAPPEGFDESLSMAKALAFTSANGVRAFAAASDARNLRVFTVGAATAAAAHEAGFADVASADGDAESLARLILSERPSGMALHIRGAHGRGDLAGRLRSAGVEMSETVLYEMRAADRLHAEIADALARSGVDAVAFYSPRTAKIFAALVEGAGLAPLSGLCAAAISEAAAEPLAALGLRRVRIAAHPDAEAMLRAIGRPDSDFS